MAEIIALGLFDQIETKIVTALKAFSTEQKAIDPAAEFDVSQGRMRPVGSLPKPLVNVWMPGLTAIYICTRCLHQLVTAADVTEMQVAIMAAAQHEGEAS